MSILNVRPETQQLPITPLGPSFGAEIRGIALGSLEDDRVLALREALVRYKVLFVRGKESLNDATQIEFGRRLGEVTIGHPVHDSGEVAPEVYSLDSQDNGFADVWHTDVTCVRRPPAISVLRAVVLPPTGGDTNWADSQLAYESLSPDLRAYVDTLTAVHDGSREFGYYLAQRRQGRGNLWEGERFTELTPVEHPVVRVRLRAREPRHPRHPQRPPHQARTHRATPLAAGRRRLVGQPQHGALRQPRLRRPAPRHAPHHPARGHTRRSQHRRPLTVPAARAGVPTRARATQLPATPIARHLAPARPVHRLVTPTDLVSALPQDASHPSSRSAARRRSCRRPGVSRW
ncbi:TauD/TfdA dioxygenase family protein [Streptomyces anulatus]|uniref:TauD/TfdA dioxygenase family protein n=1 Tax=Streptomyces anulatus TaxID=1892 RepID=UPI003F4D9020